MIPTHCEVCAREFGPDEVFAMLDVAAACAGPCAMALNRRVGAAVAGAILVELLTRAAMGGDLSEREATLVDAVCAAAKLFDMAEAMEPDLKRAREAQRRFV